MADKNPLLLLAGQRVLVSGAGRGIGQAIAKICFAHGAQVAVCARTTEQLTATAEAMQALEKQEGADVCPDQRTVRTYTVDVTQPTEVHTMVEDIVQAWGGIDILINNAGRGQARKGIIADGEKSLSTDDFHDLLNLNVVAVHTLTAAVVPHMPRNALSQSQAAAAEDTPPTKNNPSGTNHNTSTTLVTPQIINISSKAGRVGLPGMSHYVASKFALQGLTASWATELAQEGIRVNAISPGMVNTTSFPKSANRPGVRTAESIADGLLLLLQSNGVTGHYLHVDDLDLVRQRKLPDVTALQPINAVDSTKRPREDDDTTTTTYHLKEPPSWTKRRAIGGQDKDRPVTAQIPTPPCKFLPFHFRMLKSLYEDSCEEDTSGPVDHRETDNRETTDSVAVEPNDTIWQDMKDFVSQRTQILQAQKEAQESKNVHLTAEQYLEDSSRGLPATSKTGGVVVGDSSPLLQRRHSITTVTSPSIPSPMSHSRTGSMKGVGNYNAFGLVSLLLQKRATAVQARYEEATRPFGKLQDFVQQQMTALHTSIQRLEDAIGSSTESWRQQLVDSPRSPTTTLPNQETEQRQRSALAAAQTKLHLWMLISQDLDDALQKA